MASTATTIRKRARRLDFRPQSRSLVRGQRAETLSSADHPARAGRGFLKPYLGPRPDRHSIFPGRPGGRSVMPNGPWHYYLIRSTMKTRKRLAPSQQLSIHSDTPTFTTRDTIKNAEHQMSTCEPGTRQLRWKPSAAAET